MRPVLAAGADLSNTGPLAGGPVNPGCLFSEDALQKYPHLTPGGLIRFGVISQRHIKSLALGIGFGIGKAVFGAWVIHYAKGDISGGHFLLEGFYLLGRN